MRTLTLLLAMSLLAAPARAAGELPAVEGLTKAFDDADVVMLGERAQSKLDSDFRVLLVQTPAFVYKVNDIVVEFASARWQHLLDAYLLDLREVPDDSLRLVWRDATQPGTWESPAYEGLIKRVRLANRMVPLEARLRVVAADPPVDWSKIARWQDIAPTLASRPEYAVQVIEREVLDRNRKALVVFGERSLNRADRDLPIGSSISQRLANARPNARVLVVTPVPQSDSLVTRLDATVNAAERPLLIRLSRSPLGKLPARMFFDHGAGTLSQTTDALLYFGNIADRPIRPGREVMQDTAFIEELKRRRAIVGI